MNASVKDQISQSDKDMIALGQALLNLHGDKKNDIITHWYSYTCYYHSFLFMIRKGQFILDVCCLSGSGQNHDKPIKYRPYV